jgi:hypothetical protein
MAACLARINDRVNASVEDRLSAWQNPESVSKRDEKEPRGEERKVCHVVEHKENRILETGLSEMHLWMLAFWSNTRSLYTTRRG